MSIQANARRFGDCLLESRRRSSYRSPNASPKTSPKRNFTKSRKPSHRKGFRQSFPSSKRPPCTTTRKFRVFSNFSDQQPPLGRGFFNGLFKRAKPPPYIIGLKSISMARTPNLCPARLPFAGPFRDPATRAPLVQSASGVRRSWKSLPRKLPWGWKSSCGQMTDYL